MPSDEPAAPAIPLARWADRQLRLLGGETGSPRIAALDGTTIVGERGANGGYVVNGKVSAGIGGSRLMPTRDHGWFALTIIRAEDRELLPALFGDADIDITDNEAIARAVARHDCAELVARGRLLGLPVPRRTRPRPPRRSNSWRKAPVVSATPTTARWRWTSRRSGPGRSPGTCCGWQAPR